MRLQIDIPPGELADRLTIIQIKSNKIKDPAKMLSIMADLRQLTDVMDELCNWCTRHDQWKALTPLTVELRKLNTEIWDIEDKIRALEKVKDFGDEFIQTARSVYFTNDKRAEVKRQINELFNSDIKEEKSYTDYT